MRSHTARDLFSDLDFPPIKHIAEVSDSDSEATEARGLFQGLERA